MALHRPSDMRISISATRLALATLCVFVFTADAQSVRATAPPKGNVYAHVDSLHCGRQDVVVVSSCIARDEDNSDPYCFSQEVTFVDEKYAVTNSIRYAYPTNSNQFVYGAHCLASGGNFIVEMSSSNLGNCAQCEWSDYFTESGKYIASTPSPKPSSSIKRQLLNKSQHQMIRAASLIRKVEITTVAQ
jgi:hypothetical protein